MQRRSLEGGSIRLPIFVKLVHKTFVWPLYPAVSLLKILRRLLPYKQNLRMNYACWSPLGLALKAPLTDRLIQFRPGFNLKDMPNIKDMALSKGSTNIRRLKMSLLLQLRTMSRDVASYNSALSSLQ